MPTEPLQAAVACIEHMGRLKQEIQENECIENHASKRQVQGSTKLQDANLCLLISSVKLVNSRRGVRFRDCEASPLMRCGHVVDDVHGSSNLGPKIDDNFL